MHQRIVPARKQAKRYSQKPKRFLHAILAGRFLIVSILIHLLFIGGATIWVVQKYYTKPKIEFKGGERGANQIMRAFEYKIQVAKKKQTMSKTPIQTRRVTTKAFSKVSIPDVPLAPSTGEIGPIQIGGATGTLGESSPIGLGSPGGMGGASMPFFGFSKSRAGTLEGSFYNLKEHSGGKFIEPDNQFYPVIGQFVKSGWSDGFLNKFFKSPAKIYASQIFHPSIQSEEGPKAFGITKIEDTPYWVVHYVGKVSPPESGTYHFVGAGDGCLLVRFQGKLVLDRSWGDGANGGTRTNTGWKPQAIYDYGYPQGMMEGSFAKGNAITVEVGHYYDIEILIGDQGGLTSHYLWIEKEGAEYKRDAKGNPILPIFRISNVTVPPLKGDQIYPPYADNGPVWKAAAQTASSLDLLGR
ncbi:MAG: hypothetical protein WCH43_03345 [Verrucomicrobiota bacterium]